MANNNIKRRFTVELAIDTEKAEAQAKGVLKNLGTLFADFQTKGDKLTYFKELVDYLRQIDSELTRLKKIHGAKSVDKAFGDLGKQLQKQLKDAFSINGQDFAQFDVFRQKINQIVQSGGKTADLLPIAKEINEFFDLLGRKDMHIDISSIGGDVKVEADEINDYLNEVIKTFNLVRRNISIGLGGSGNGPSFDTSNIEEAVLTYDKLKEKILELSDAQRLYDVGLTVDVDGIDLETKIDELNEYIVSLDKTGEKVKLIRGILENLQFHDINEDQALTQLCETLQVDLPKGIVKFQEFMKMAEQFRDFNYISKEDSDAGIQKLEVMKAELVDLAKQGDITADQLDQVNTVFNTAMTNLKKMDHDSHKGPGMGDGSGLGTGTGSGDHIGTVDVDFTRLESAISSEAKRIVDKLNSTLDVNVVSDMTKIASVVNEVKGIVEKISSEIDAYRTSQVTDAKQAEINTMKQNLTQLLSQVNQLNNKKNIYGLPQGQELSAQFMSDGTISTAYGEKGSVPWDRMIAQLVKNLNSKLIMDIHSHPLHSSADGSYKYTTDYFSGSKGDLAAWQVSKSLGANLAGMITGNILRTFDVSKLTRETYQKFVKNLSQVEEKYSKDSIYGQYIGKNSDGSRYYKSQTTMEGMHMVSKVFEEIMYEALKRTGFSLDQINKDIFQKYDLTDDTQLAQLAVKLVDLNESAQSSIAPVQRLSDILQGLGVNTTTSEATTALLGFEKGEMSAVDVINKLAPDYAHISDELVNSVQTIDSNNQLSVAETTLNSILDVLNTINKTIGSIQTSIKSEASTELSSAMDDVLKAQHGAKLDGSAFGIKSIYDPNNISKYQVDDVLRIAKDSVGDTMSKILLSDGIDLGISEVNDLVLSFKTSLSYIEDAMKQVMQYDKIHGGDIKTTINGTEQAASWVIADLRDTLLNVDEVINPLLGMLKSTRDKIQTAEDKYDIGTVKTNQTEVGHSSVEYTANVTGLQQEKREIEELIRFLNQVKVAVDAKTLSFEKEGNVVKSVVQSEENQLDILEAKIGRVTDAVDNKTSAFADEQGTVTNMVQAEIDELEKLRLKLVEIQEAVRAISNFDTIESPVAVDDSDAKLKEQEKEWFENSALENKKKIYNNLIERAKELIRLQGLITDDRFLLPKYFDGHLQSGYGYDGRSIRDNKATKSSIRKHLDFYSIAKEQGNDRSAEYELKDLISCVATYKDLNEARDVFKKKEESIWQEVISRINAAKEAKEAYETFTVYDTATMGTAAGIGDIIDKSYTLKDLNDFHKAISTGDVQNVMDYLTKRFQISAPNMEGYTNEIQQQNEELKEQGVLLDSIEQKESKLSNTSKNVTESQNATPLEALRQKINAIKEAVDAKTQAFENESIVVDATVDAEIAKLNELLGKLKEVKSEINLSKDNIAQNESLNLGSVEPDISSDLSYAFKGMDLKGFIERSVNKDAKKQLEEEFYKFAQTYIDEDAEAMYSQASNIADFIVDNSRTFRERKEENIYEDAFKALQMAYTDDDAAAMGPQLLERAKSILGRKLQKASDKNKHFDRIDQAMSTLAANYPSLFEDPNGNESHYNKLEQLLDTFDTWKREGTRKTRDVTLDENDTQGIIDYIYQEMLAPMMANIDEQRTARNKASQMSIDGFSDVQQDSNTTSPSSLSDEIAQLENLRKKVNAVKKAVVEKTEAFNAEGSAVDTVVAGELQSLHLLFEALQMVSKQIDDVVSGLSYINSQNIQVDNNVNENVEEIDTNKKQHIETQIDSTVKDYALDSTLQTTNSILNEISGKLNQEQDFSDLINPLKNAATELQNVANGIVQHQKAQKSDTSVAMARIQDPNKLAHMTGIAKDAVTTLGADVEIESYQALTDGLVKFEGVFKNAQGQWEGFTVKVNEHNEAIDLAVKKHSAFASQLNKQKDEDANTYIYSKEEVEARAQKHLDEYAAQGKNATVQFKDSGRYTITILEEIDGLSKKIFQTFDENDKMIERTTVTMSNNQKTKLDNLRKKLIDDGIDKGLISDKDKAYADYQTATDELNKMNVAYSKLDSISDEEIAKWKQQIVLVQQLGNEVSNLIQTRKTAKDAKVFASDRDKKLSKFDLEKTTLQQDINIPDSFNDRINGSRTAIANATDSDGLKIAINNWEALKNEIKETAKQKDLYIKKDKQVAKNSSNSFDDIIIRQSRGQVNALLDGLGFKKTGSDLKADQQRIVDTYREALKVLDAYKNSTEESKAIELSRVNEVISRLKEQVKTYKQVHDISNVSTKNFGSTVTRRETTRYGKMQALALDPDSGYSSSDEFMSKFKKYKIAYDQLIAKQKEFAGLDSLTNEQVAEWDELKDACMQAGKEIERAVNASEKLKNNSWDSKALGPDFADEDDIRKRFLTDYIKSIVDADIKSKKFKNNYKDCVVVVEESDGTFKQISATIDTFGHQMVSNVDDLGKSTSTLGNIWDEFKRKVSSIGTYLVAMFGFEELIQQFRQGVEYVREIDTALTDLKKVTRGTEEEYNKFLQSMSQTANVVGSTVADLTTMSAEWARLGYSMKEAGELAESTAILLNVSEFEDATTASEALISTMQAFGYAANESGHVVDILNEVKLLASLYSDV